MKRLISVVATAALTLGMGCTLALAAAQGPKVKLPAPENVTCPLTVDGVLVSFDAVADANAYQVEYMCVNALGAMSEESVFVLTSPVLIDDEDCAVVAVHVRAMPAPKHEGGPLQGSGPKGQWSELCQVVAP